MELANQAVSLFEINHRIQDLCPAMVVRGIVNLNRSRMGNAPAIRKAAEDFRKALSMCNGKKSPRVHYAAAHNLGLTILEGNLPWDDLKETIGSVKQARENLRKRKIKRRSVPDAKLRWILGLARSRSGWNPQAERLLTTARNDLITLGAMSEVALVSLDLGELYLAEDRWDDLARISADVVHMDRGSYSHEIFAAL
ncbi:MAG: hypothetical protein GY866_00420, partial [Proteobacteria bacterium]|nr:hypothetical protein [Pseudomonadota bacterium]